MGGAGNEYVHGNVSDTVTETAAKAAIVVAIGPAKPLKI